MDSATEWRGGQVQLALLLQGLRERGLRVLLAAPPRGELAARVGAPDLPLAAGNDPRAAWQLRSWLARNPVDLVAAQTSHAHGSCVLAGLSPVVHRRVDFAPSSSRASRFKYRRAGLFVAVSDGVRQMLRAAGVPPHRIRVVHDGVRPLGAADPAPDLTGDGPLLLAVGALVEHKGHRVLLEALARLPGQRCVIAGEGPSRGRLQRQIEALGLQGRVQLLGQRQDVPALFAAADLLVHPSVEEGMGQVVVEAMAAGLAVLVSDAGGLPEVVGDGCCPVPAGDPAALAAAIRTRLDDPRRYDLPLARLRARELFSVEAMVEGTLQAYTDYVQQEQRPDTARSEA